MPVHVPGPELGSSIPFKHLGMAQGGGRKSVDSPLNLTAFVDTMTVLVTFLLMSFSASGEILMSQKGLELPEAINQNELKRAPIVVVAKDTITFNGEQVGDPRALMDDTSMEWKIIELYERLNVERLKFVNNMDPAKQDLLGLLILQADKEVDVKIINRVMKTAYAAEYPNIMFAVNQRAGAGGAH